MQRNSGYPLYDVTSSPISSSAAKTQGAEMNNPNRVGKEIDEQNYARFSFSGKAGERKMTVQYLGVKGEKLGEWSVHEKDLRSQ